MLSIVTFSTQKTFASEIEQAFSPNEVSVDIQSSYASEHHGELFVFNTLQDKTLFDEIKAQENARFFNPIQPRIKHIRTVNLGRKWVNYNPLTPSWSKASSYSITATSTVTASGSFSYQGATFGISATLSKGVAINVPSNPNRYSRLGFEADVQIKEYKIEYYHVDNPKKVVKTVYSKTPVVTNTYNVVRYK